jgi:hypothetical protein
MKKVIWMMVLSLVLLSGCGQQTESETLTTEPGSVAQEATLGTVAEYDGCMVELQEAEFFTRDGQDMIRVYMTYTNNNADGLYLYESFSIKAFQNDVEIENCTDINDDELSVPVIQEVKNGESVVGSYVFAISGTDDVEVRVCTPTADEELLAGKVYAYEAQDTN